MEDRDYEAEARKDGWVPQEEWKGPDDKWKPAEQFVKDGEQINGFLRSKVDRLEGRINQLLDSNEKLNEWSKKQQDRDKKEREKLINELEAARRQAVTDGDGEAFDVADKRINELRSEPQDIQERLNPIQRRWLEQNSWYESNEKLAAFADGIAERLVAQGFTGQAYFDELTQRTKDAFPEAFGNEKRSKPASVEAGGEAARDSSEHTWENLPKEAKAAFAQFKRDIPGFTKEQYLASYDWE